MSRVQTIGGAAAGHARALGRGTSQASIRPARLAAALSLYAAIGHIIATPPHFREWWGYGVFFLAMAVGQALFAAGVLRWPTQPIALLGIAGNLAIVGMYVLSRTVGPPAGPHGGRGGIAEEPALLDLTTTVVELALVVTLVMLLRGAVARWTLNALLALGALLWGARLAGYL